MKNEGGREAGKCSKVVPDRGDRCLFIFFMKPSSFLQHISTIILLIIRQYYWRTDVPCANSNGGPNTKKKLLAHCVWSGLLICGGGHRCANILAHRSTLLTEKEQPARQLCWWCGGIQYILHVSKRPTEQFGAPRLFSYQSPIN
jgi:hypothetical protein